MRENIKYYDLTHPQKRIWYVDKININSQLHNIGGCLKVRGIIDIEYMKKTLNILIKTNNSLRLRFTEKEGQPIQYIHGYEEECIDFIDFSNYDMPKVKHEKWADAILRKSFDIKDNKLYYFAIYKINEDEFGILLNIHHIISDGWSISIMEKQVCEIYSKLIRNEIVSLEECYSYLDFIEKESNYLNSDRFKKNRNFWL